MLQRVFRSKSHKNTMGGVCGSGQETSEGRAGYRRATRNTMDSEQDEIRDLSHSESIEKVENSRNDKKANIINSSKQEQQSQKPQTMSEDIDKKRSNTTSSNAKDGVSPNASNASKDSKEIKKVIEKEEIKEEDLLNIENNVNSNNSASTLSDSVDAWEMETRDTTNNSKNNTNTETNIETNTESAPASRRASESTIARAEMIAEQQKESHTEQKKREIIGSLPNKIETPLESLDVANIGKKGYESDSRVLEAITKRFESDFNKHKVEKNTFYRFVIGYRHIKNEKERIEYTCECLSQYFSVHKKLEFDTLLSDKTRSESTAVEMEGWPVYIYGQDRMGHVLIWDEIGSVDVKKLDTAFRGKDFSLLQLHRARIMRKVENLKHQNQMKYKENYLYKHSMIFDLKHFSLSKHGAKERREICKKVIEEMTNMYPECVFRIYVLNAPGAFRAFYQILKLFMDPITADKTKVLGKNYLKELVKDMDIEMIPTKYGGKGVWKVQYCDVPKGYPQDAYVGL